MGMYVSGELFSDAVNIDDVIYHLMDLQKRIENGADHAALMEAVGAIPEAIDVLNDVLDAEM